MDATHAVRLARTSTRDLTAAALITALLAASAWVSIPVGSVPVTLQVFFVILAALLLPPWWAAASMGAYIALGAMNLPVFAGGKAGTVVLAGPTGGYLVGFVVGALIGALAREALANFKVRAVVADGLAAAATVAVIYLLGITQLAIVLALSPGAAIATGALPFIAFDLAKAVAAVTVAAAVRKALTVAAR